VNDAPRYAALFRTHFWDGFVQRQFDRLAAQVGPGDLFVMVDDTGGPVQVPHDRVFRITEQDALGAGLPRAGEGNLLWFNGDYPLHLFLGEHPEYEYYVQVEYDVVLGFGVETLVRQAAAAGADFIGLTKGQPVPEWHWRTTCRDVYELDEVSYKLICLSVFSRRALQLLFRRRLELAARLAREPEMAWPFCEAFISTEIERGGLVSLDLAKCCDTETYDHWPPYLEAELPKLAARPLLHPVLDERRYTESLLKYKIGLGGYLNPNSLYHRKLRKLPADRYVSALARSFLNKAFRDLRLGWRV
jgi:hypothetical protein